MTSDPNGRFIIVSGKLGDVKVVLANVYAPNYDDAGFFKKFFSSLPDLSSYALILGGDFNCCLDPVLDRSSPKPGIFSKSASTIQSFLLDHGISNVWRCLYSQDSRRREYSFFSHVHHSYSRIDFFCSK